ncbi:MAG: hypothetical protein SOU03_06415 [Dorea sp.]|nr:hypothetical protein [Dorea sp.]
MEQFIWETPEELDKKLAMRVRNIRKRRSIIFTQVPYRNIEEVINETR